MPVIVSLEDALAPITDGCLLAVPREQAGVAMEATHTTTTPLAKRREGCRRQRRRAGPGLLFVLAVQVDLARPHDAGLGPHGRRFTVEAVVAHLVVERAPADAQPLSRSAVVAAVHLERF